MRALRLVGFATTAEAAADASDVARRRRVGALAAAAAAAAALAALVVLRVLRVLCVLPVLAVVPSLSLPSLVAPSLAGHSSRFMRALRRRRRDAMARVQPRLKAAPHVAPKATVTVCDGDCTPRFEFQGRFDVFH